MQTEYSSCNQCNEYRKVALRKKLKPTLCHNCADTKHRRGFCELCHRDHLPLERHHLAGRKHAPATLSICLSCHAMLSRRQYEWPDLWRREPCALFLIWGVLDFYVLAFDPTVPFTILSNRCEEAMAEATRRNVVGPYSLIQVMLLIAVLVLVIQFIAVRVLPIGKHHYAQ